MLIITGTLCSAKNDNVCEASEIYEGKCRVAIPAFPIPRNTFVPQALFDTRALLVVAVSNGLNMRGRGIDPTERITEHIAIERRGLDARQV